MAEERRERVLTEARQLIRDHNRLACCSCESCDVANTVIELDGQIKQVDDVLVVNWITAKENNYKQALHDLVTRSIAEYNDPLISQSALDQRREHEAFGAAKEIIKQALTLWAVGSTHVGVQARAWMDKYVTGEINDNEHQNV